MAVQEGITRRSFLRDSALTAAAGTILANKAQSAQSPRKVLGANDRVNIAVIGIRGQGFAHIQGFARIPNVQIKTLCDIDENLYPERLKYLQDKHGYAPKTEWDMRKVLEDKDIDAVTFA